MITSKENEAIKNLIKLYTPKGRKETGMFVVEGPHLVKEAKMANVLVKAYTTDDSLEGELISLELMKYICKTNTAVTQIGVCKKIDKNEISDKVLFLDGIQDPGNLGTLLRSAKAFDFNTVFLAKGTVDIYNDKVIRSSQGAIFKLNFIQDDKLEFLKRISKTHKIYSTNVVEGITVDKAKKGKLVLILGNEGNGVSKEINDLKFDNLYIPMNNMESLNVGVAGSILMYELAK